MPDLIDSTNSFVRDKEFDRWMREESDFRRALEERMAETARILGAGLTRIETHLSVLNGSTMVNTHGIAALEKRLIHIETEYAEVIKIVNLIRQAGCSKYEQHAQILNDLSVSGWTARKKAVAVGGLVSVGALIWPAVQEIAKVVHALINWIGPR